MVIMNKFTMLQSLSFSSYKIEMLKPVVFVVCTVAARGVAQEVVLWLYSPLKLITSILKHTHLSLQKNKRKKTNVIIKTP